MEAESVKMSKVAVMKMLAGKDLLSLSVTSSCSSSYVQEEEEEEEEKSKKVVCFSSYEQDKEKLKEMGDLKRKREEGSSNSISPQEQVSTFRMWERSLKVARGMENKKCPGPLIPCSTSSLSDQETVKLIEKLMQKHGCISPVVGEGSFTRSKGISVPIFTDNSGLRVTHSSSSPQEEEGRERQLYFKEAKSEVDDMLHAKDCSKSKVCNLAYTMWPTTIERRWLETGLWMGVTRLSKRATQSDTNPNQHTVFS